MKSAQPFYVNALIINSYSFHSLIVGAKWPEGIDPTKRETYLSNIQFAKIFGMDKETSAQLPQWKQEALKKEKKLF